jgi:hypothetical protein
MKKDARIGRDGDRFTPAGHFGFAFSNASRASNLANYSGKSFGFGVIDFANTQFRLRTMKKLLLLPIIFLSACSSHSPASIGLACQTRWPAC